MFPDIFAAGEACVNIPDCFMSRTVLHDIWCLTFFCNAELFKKKKNIKLFQAVLNMQIAKLGKKEVRLLCSLFVFVHLRYPREHKKVSERRPMNHCIHTSLDCLVRREEVLLPICQHSLFSLQHIAAPIRSLLKDLKWFCEENLFF